jgi:hypothetical protein
MNLLEESLRIKKMMVIEQSSSDNYFKEFSEGNFNNLKEFLSNNSEFVNKLKRILHQDSIESIESSLVKSNKTNLMRGMSDAKKSKDMDLYKFLEIFLKNADVLS